MPEPGNRAEISCQRGNLQDENHFYKTIAKFTRRSLVLQDSASDRLVDGDFFSKLAAV
jgi:hypothetical protein